MEREKVLIVEDDRVTSEILKQMLSNKNFIVTDILSDSESVLESIEKKLPDLILMDIIIKGERDGIEIANLIKEKYEIPVIYLTSDTSDNTIERAKISEPFGYLIKPINEKILLASIEFTLQKQYIHNKKILDTLRKANDELENRVEERTKELITKNKQLEIEMKQRKQAEEQLKKSEQLATIGKMSAVLAHEIRNPLNSIKINTDILSGIQNIKDTNRRRIQIIQKEVNRLDTLVKEVLQFSRQGNVLKSEFDIKNLIEQIKSQLKPEAEHRNANLINDVDNYVIYADKEKLKQVLLNLILNSLEALPETNGVIQIYSETKKGKFRLYIRDNGFGIENSEKIFDPFFTTKSNGTGLGLPVSMNIIEQHNGIIELKSTKQGETIFCISLPLKKK
ncbi:MAG: response regulator [Ignavibacteria bacterium]|nr:response regulator [Ignavibacteria bacterium]